jgi:hypothetical protein
VTGTWGGISRTRVVIGAAGGLVTAFGVYRLVSEVPVDNLLALAIWLLGALLLHDAVLSPAIVGIGMVVRRLSARSRTYVQGALIAGGVVTVIAVPMIYRTGTQPQVKAILDQDFRVNLLVLLAVIATAALLSYLRQVVRERGRAKQEAAEGDRSQEEQGRDGRSVDHVGRSAE